MHFHLQMPRGLICCICRSWAPLHLKWNFQALRTKQVHLGNKSLFMVNYLALPMRILMLQYNWLYNWLPVVSVSLRACSKRAQKEDHIFIALELKLPAEMISFSYFSSCYDNHPDQNNLRKESLFRLMVQVNPSWWRNHWGRSMRQLASLHYLLRAESKRHLCSVSYYIYTVRHTSQGV